MDQGGPFAQRSGRFLVDMPVFLLNGRVQGRVGLAEQVEGAALRALADADDAQGAAGPGSGRSSPQAACPAAWAAGRRSADPRPALPETRRARAGHTTGSKERRGRIPASAAGKGRAPAGPPAWPRGSGARRRRSLLPAGRAVRGPGRQIQRCCSWRYKR